MGSKTLKVKTEKDHYTAGACVVWCYDNRFWNLFNEFLKAQEIKNFDPIVIAGGSKSLASPDNESEREFLLKQIELSIKLHHTDRVILMNHSDCGGYGGLKKFGDEEKEFTAHKGELEAARKVVESRFPGIRIDTVFADFEGIQFI